MRSDQLKKDLRTSFQQRGQLFQVHQSAFNVERLNENLIQFMSSQKGVWAAFRAWRGEPDLDKVTRVSTHITWVYPRVKGESLEFVKAQKFAKGRFGLEEPLGENLVDPQEITGFLVPGLAFDRQGGRLGRGEGFYDRALSQVPGFRLGVGFSYQIYENILPKESFDVPMHAWISEQALLAFTGMRGQEPRVARGKGH